MQHLNKQVEARTPLDLAFDLLVTIRPRDSLQTALACVDRLELASSQDVRPCLRHTFIVGIFADVPPARANTTFIRSNAVPAARNAAILEARSPYILFIDADVRPDPACFARLLRTLHDDPVAAAVKGVYVTNQEQRIARLQQIEYEEKYARLSRQSIVDVIDLYAAAYRRDVLVQNGAFDERFATLGDRELSFRLAARGYRLRFDATARVEHDHVTTLGAYLHSKVQTGYWKALVVRRFPERTLSDSHTPPSLKIQMALALVCLISLLAAIWAPFARAAFAAGSVLFVISALPFLRRVWEHDRGILPSALPLLVGRALALAIGFGWGSAQRSREFVNRQTTISGWQYVAKRGMDIVGALVGGTLCLALTPFIALAIRLDSTGPIFFTQERIGYGGHAFRIYKFRSMTVDAEEQLSSLIDIDALEQPVFKLVQDPRVTRVGRFLRRWSLDELPQFFNVLRGEMSLIGPRPEETRLVARYTPWQRRRLAVKPGLTGPMQVGGRGDLSLDERVQLEIAYIENFSLWNDLKLLWRTLPAIARGSGAR